MDHGEFVRAWREGRVRVALDRAAAARLVSARLLLPFIAIAVIGAGIAVVLLGHIWAGIAIGAIGILGPRLIKRGAGGFVLSQIAEDPEFFAQAVRSGAVQVIEGGADTGQS